jgi:hypothetical protein
VKKLSYLMALVMVLKSQTWINMQCHYIYMIIFLVLEDDNGKWRTASHSYNGKGKAVLAQMVETVPSLENILFYLSFCIYLGKTQVTMKMKACSSETSVTTHNPELCQNPEAIWSTSAMKTWKPIQEWAWVSGHSLLHCICPPVAVSTDVLQRSINIIFWHINA